MKYRPSCKRRLTIAITALALLAPALDAAAQVARIGETFAVAGATSANHRFPSVSFDAANDAYLVVWGIWPVHARYVSPNGAPLGSAVPVSVATQSSAVRVACGKEVNACLVAWLEEAGTTIKVVGRLVRYSGGSVTFITDPFVISYTPANLQFAPAVAYSSASQQFLVTWSASGGIFGHLVSGSGAPAGTLITVANTALVEFAPSMAYNSAQNEFMVAFEFESGATSGVRGQRLDGTTGAFIGTANTLVASTYERYPEIAYNSRDNQYLAITYGWSAGKWMLHGVVVSGAGDPITSALPLALNCAGDGLGVAYNPISNNYFAVTQYAFNGGICGVEVSLSGTPGTPFLVTAGGANDTAVQPRVIADQSRSRFLAVAGKNFAYIMGQMLGGDGASGGGPPATPSLISPSGTITTASPTYSWYASSGATHYQVFVSDASGTRAQDWHHVSAVGCSSGSGTCSLTPSLALVKGNATWWVKAWNASGESAWSAPMYFTVAPGLPGTATLLSPGGTISTNSPVFKWTAVSNATMYYLWVKDSIGVRVQSWYNAASVCSSSGTCGVNTGVLFAGAGAFWVQTWNADGGYGPWSVGKDFTIATPVLMSPWGNHGTRIPVYVWIAVPGATHYQVFVRDSSGIRVWAWYHASVLGCDSANTCAVSAGITLVAGHGMWQVQSWGPDGYGNWSAGAPFRTAVLDAPTLISGGPLQATPWHVKFDWYRTGGATHYQLWVTDSVGVRVQRWFTATELGCIAGTTCTITITPPLYSGTVWWWVRPWTDDVGNGPWSPGMQFVR